MSANDIYDTRLPPRPGPAAIQLVFRRDASLRNADFLHRRHHPSRPRADAGQAVQRANRSVGWLLDPYAISMPLWSSEDMQR